MNQPHKNAHKKPTSSGEDTLKLTGLKVALEAGVDASLYRKGFKLDLMKLAESGAGYYLADEFVTPQLMGMLHDYLPDMKKQDLKVIVNVLADTIVRQTGAYLGVLGKEDIGKTLTRSAIVEVAAKSVKPMVL